MSRGKRYRVGAGLFIGGLLSSILIPWGQAEVTLDGSLGPSGALPGPKYAITADLGRQVGGICFIALGDSISPSVKAPPSVGRVR